MHQIAPAPNSRNALATERPKPRPLLPARATDPEDTVFIVTCNSGFLLRHVFYTVPSRPIEHSLRVRLYDDRPECFLGSTPVLTPTARLHPIVAASRSPGCLPLFRL